MLQATSHRQAKTSVRFLPGLRKPIDIKGTPAGFCMEGFHVQTAISLSSYSLGLISCCLHRFWLNFWWELLGMPFPKPRPYIKTDKMVNLQNQFNFSMLLLSFLSGNCKI